MVAQNLDKNGLPLHGMVVNKERKINVNKKNNTISMSLNKNMPYVQAFT